MKLDFDRVQYECCCGSWRSSSYLYICQNCPRPRCLACVSEELEAQSYCTSCLDDTQINDSRTGYCSNCYLCPTCGTTLSQRATSEGHFLHCSFCMWTTNDIGLKPRSKATDWDLPQNPMEERYNQIKDVLKNLSLTSGKQGLSQQTMRKTYSNLGIPANNKYGLGKAVQARNRQLNPTATKVQLSSSTNDVPGLDPSIFTQEVDPSAIRTLDQDLALTGQYGAIYPIRKPLCSRRLVRCPEHDCLLYRAEYSLLSTAPKNYAYFLFQYPLSQFCPEIKFSHEVEFSSTDEFSVFLSISNSSTSSLQVTVAPLHLDDPNCLTCLNNSPIEQLISRKDGTATDDELINLYASYDATEIGTIVFNQKHRIGIHLRCKAKTGTKPESAYLILKMCFHREEKPTTVFEQRVRVFIQQQI